MKGFLSVSTASPRLHLANPSLNEQEIIKTITSQKNDILLFPELSLCGVTCGDLVLQQALLQGVAQALQNICTATQDVDTLVFVGAPLPYNGALYNCMVAILRGDIIAIVPKPIQGDQHRHFSNWHNSVTTCPVSNIDIASIPWPQPMPSKQVPCGTDIIFNINGAQLALAKPGHMHSHASITLSPWAYPANATYIPATLATTATAGNKAIIYTSPNVMESTTDYIYDSTSIIAENGAILACSPSFEIENQPLSSVIDTDIIKPVTTCPTTHHITVTTSNPLEPTSYDPDHPELKSLNNRHFSPAPFYVENVSYVFMMQAHALARRLAHAHAKTAIIGISGGVDSTLALLVTKQAFEILGKNPADIIAVTMPGLGTTGTTYNNAKDLINCTGATLKEISIVNAVKQHFADIGQDENNHDVTYENAQARERTQILMDLANMHQGIVIGTGSMSEAALGFATYNGDHISMYNPNGGVPKTLAINILQYFATSDEVFSIHFAKQNLRKVLADILNTPISPELLPPNEAGTMSQKTEDILGTYDLTDFFLYYVLHGAHPTKIEMLATMTFVYIDPEVIKKRLQNFYRRFFINQYKRSASTDAPNVVGVSLSPRGGFVMPSDAQSEQWTLALKVQ